MKKDLSLIVSDYDGTYMDYNKMNLIYENNKLIDDYINNNGLFMLSTGRMFYSIREKIQKYNIPYNYLSCANGCVLLDSEDRIYFLNTINKNDIELLKAYYKYFDDFKLLDLYGKENNNQFIETVFRINSNYHKIRKEIINRIITSNNINYYTEHDDKNTIHVFGNVGKLKTIQIVQSKHFIPVDKVFVIGDSTNDLDMLKEYNGYVIRGGKISSEKYGFKEYEYFKDFMGDVNNKKLLIKKP